MGILFVLVPLAVGVVADGGIWWLYLRTAGISNGVLRLAVRVVLGVVAIYVFLFAAALALL